jgi:hypothetical protein
LLKAFVAVFWAFFGVRKGEDHKKDLDSLKLFHVIFAGIFGAAFFVITLLVLVNFVVT